MKRRRLLFINIGQFRLIVRKSVVTGLFITAVVLLVLSRSQSPAVRTIRSNVSAVFSPVVSLVQYPVHWIYGAYESVADLFRVYGENQRLKQQYDHMLVLRTRLQALENENKELARLLRYTPPAEASFMTAKIVVQEEDGFSHSVIAYLGDYRDRVFAGQPVLGSDGVLGRVESVEGAYARIVLLTDINSKIPVMTADTKIRGILSGDNTAFPKLVFTPAEAELKVGDQLVTSGTAGTFPSGLPIGKIVQIHPDLIEVEPTDNVENIEYVRVVDYGVNGVVLDRLFSEERP